MTVPALRRFAPVAVVGGLFIIAVAVAAWHGYATVAVLLALNGVLITGYAAHHRARSPLVYDRHRKPVRDAHGRAGERLDRDPGLAYHHLTDRDATERPAQQAPHGGSSATSLHPGRRR